MESSLWGMSRISIVLEYYSFRGCSLKEAHEHEFILPLKDYCMALPYLKGFEFNEVRGILYCNTVISFVNQLNIYLGS